LQGLFRDAGLGPRPGLRLVQKRTNLGEQVGRKGVPALERLDALQPGEDAPCFLHLSTVAPGSRRVCDASGTKPSTRDRAGGEIAGRPRSQAEQGLVERGQEPRTVVVLEHFDDRPAQYRPGADAVLAPPEEVAAAALFALTRPPGVDVREMMVAVSTEPSWP